LSAWVEKRPIAWMQESSARRTGLWIRRSPVAATLAGCCIATLLIGGFATGYFADRARSEKELAAAIDRTIQSSNASLGELYIKLFKSEEGKKMSDREVLEEMLKATMSIPPHPIQQTPPSK
jgi:hypothetical protein